MAEKIVRVPLSHDSHGFVADHSKATGQSRAEYVLDALFFAITLETRRVSDSENYAFMVDGQWYRPPGSQSSLAKDRAVMVTMDARDAALAEQHARAKHLEKLGLYMARCTNMFNELLEFGMMDESRITGPGRGFQVVSLAPFEWDELSEQI